MCVGKGGTENIKNTNYTQQRTSTQTSTTYSQVDHIQPSGTVNEGEETYDDN